MAYRAVKLALSTGVAAAICLAATACSSSGSTTATGGTGGSGAQDVSIIQSQGVLNFAADNVAQAQGFFAKQGLNVTINYGAGDSVTDPAVLSGGDDFGIGTTLPLFTYQQQGKAPLVMAAIDDQLTQEVAINKGVASQLGITSGMPLGEEFAKLKGHKMNVGVLDIGGSLQLAFTAIAKHYGLQQGKDYTFTAIKSYPSLIVALSRDEVNLVDFGMPYGSQAEAEGNAQNFVDLWNGSYAPYAGAMFGALFTTPSYAKAHPAVVQKMYTAINQALQFIHSNPQQALKDISAADPGTPTSVLTNLLVTNKAAFFAPSATVTNKSYQVTQLVASQTGTPAATNVAYSSLIWNGAQQGS
jgi:NitT/TauT family transport system substrate-binding protein